MKNAIKKFILTSAFCALSSLSQAEIKTDNIITIKTGSFSLSKANQNINAINVNFDDAASGVLAIEYERKLRNNMTWGGEIILYENDYTPGVAYASSTHIFANIKKYFAVSKHIQPFIGTGLGGSTVTLGGTGSGSGGTLGFQAMAGISFPFESVTLLLEYKLINAKPDDDFGTSIDISGNGFFAGVGFKF